MNTLTATRQRLSAVLGAAGLHATDHLPERPVPPIALVVPGAPYLEAGPRFGTFQIRLTVLLMTATAANAVQTQALDEMAAKVVVAVADTEFGVERLDQPNQIQVNNATYLGVTIDLLCTTHIEDGDA